MKTKWIASLVCLMLIPALLLSCKEERSFKLDLVGLFNETADPAILAEGSGWFDRAGFKTGMSQHAFVQQLDTLTYQGKALTKAVIYRQFNDSTGVGMAGNSADVNYRMVRASSKAAGISTYTCSLVTRTELGGLTLPWGITFEDSLDDAIAKLGVEGFDLENMVTDEGNPISATLLASDTAALRYTDYSRDPSYTYMHPYAISLKVIAAYESADGKDVEASSILTLEYSEEQRSLQAVSILLQENTPL